MIKRFTVRSLCIFSIFTIQVLLHNGVLAQQIFTFSDRDSVRVGDILELTFVIQGTYSGLDLPDESVFPDEVDVISRQRYQISSSRDSLVYRLQFFGTQDVVLPAVAFQLQRAEGDTTLRSSRIPVYFKTLLSEEDEAFRPFKPVFTFARVWWPYFLVFLILMAAGYFLYRWIQNRDQEPQLPPKPEVVVFTDPLNELRQSISSLPSSDTLSEYADFEAFYIELGDAIRRYIKRVYRFPALEMTTREICMDLEKEQAASSTVKITRNVLNEADIVKFANFKPDSASAEHALVLAEKFCDLARTNDRNRIEELRREHQNRNAEHHKEAEKEPTISNDSEYDEDERLADKNTEEKAV